MINTSPEPFSNWGASIAEDIVVVGGLWAALNYPLVFLGLLIAFIIFVIWFLPKLWVGIKLVARKLGELFGLVERQPPQETIQSNCAADTIAQIERLKDLLDNGAITEEEYDNQKNLLLSSGGQ